MSIALSIEGRRDLGGVVAQEYVVAVPGPLHEPPAGASCSAGAETSAVELAAMRRALQDCFAAVERFGMSAGGVGFHASQPHQAAEEVLGEPALAALGWEVLEQMVDLSAHDGLVETDEHIRPPKTAVVLGNLELQDQVIAERIPGQL